MAMMTSETPAGRLTCFRRDVLCVPGTTLITLLNAIMVWLHAGGIRSRKIFATYDVVKFAAPCAESRSVPSLGAWTRTSLCAVCASAETTSPLVEYIHPPRPGVGSCSGLESN